MAGRDFDDDAPWLTEAEPRGRGAAPTTTVSRRSLFWTVVALLTLAAIAVVGTVVLLAKKQGGSTAGYMNAEQAPLIAAPPGPYKVKPGDPQGLAIDGEGETIYQTGEGFDPGGTLATQGGPEEPVLRPGSSPVAPGGMSVGAVPANGLPRDLLPEAPVAAPIAAAKPDAVKGAPIAAAPAVAPKAALPTSPVTPPTKVATTAVTAKPASKPREPLVVDIPKDEAKPKPKADVKPKDDAKPKSSGRAVAQLGAFKTEAAAQAAWTAAGGDVGGFTKRIEPIDTAGGGTLYRLRASGGDGAALCMKRSAKGVTCKVIE